MTPTTNRRPRLAVLGVALAVAALSACGDASDPATSDSSSEAPDDHRQEVAEPEPRLVVAHSDGGVTVLDAASGDVLGTTDTDEAPNLGVADDGRHVYLVQTEAGRTEVLDAGSWSSAHGDHFHHYVAPPQLRQASVDGTKPIHVVSNDGRTAIFHDGLGSAEMFDEEGLLIDSPDATTVDSGAPHHGVVVPVDAGALVSIPGPDELPLGVALVDDDGAELARFENCPELHGETIVGDTAAFGCADGVLLVTGQTPVKIPNPDASGERVGAFVATESPAVLGDYGPTSLVVVDIEAATVTVVEAGAPYGAYALGPHGEIVVLTIDGTLRVIDPTTGAASTTVPAVEAFELPEGHGGVKPTIAVVDHTVFVADPASSTVVPVDLETATVGTPIELDAAPSDLVAVGTPTHDSGH